MKHMAVKMRAHKGFTLAELLISLAILGVIATFAIPKILNSQQSSEEKAVMTEAVAAMSEVLHYGLLTGELQPNDASVRAYFTSHLNGIKSCPVDQDAEGCCTNDMLFCNDEAGVVLASGVAIYSFNYEAGGCWDGSNAFIVDVNGPEDPNTEGEDVMILTAAIDKQVGQVRIGTVGWANCSPATAASKDLYESLFEN